jgi:hypothetical protein
MKKKLEKTEGGILMPALPELPPRPVIRNKVIHDKDPIIFEHKMDAFLEGLDSYSVQYKPVCCGGHVYCNALVTYHKPVKEVEDDG